VELNDVNADVYNAIDLAASPTKLSEACRRFRQALKTEVSVVEEGGEEE
jgi:hypothetical protein